MSGEPSSCVLQVEQYTRLLNSAGCRAGRPKLDPHNIVYWFKNTRAALRRAETRLGGEAARSVWPSWFRGHCPKNTALSEEYLPMCLYGETVVTVELVFVRKEAGAEAGAGQRQEEQQGI